MIRAPCATSLDLFFSTLLDSYTEEIFKNILSFLGENG